MNKSLYLPPAKSFILSILVFVLFTTYHTYTDASQLEARPHFRNSDQTNIGIMEAKLSSPELYSRDYAFKDTSLFEFYTPTFISLATFIRQDTHPFEFSLIILLPITMLIYLTGMFLFLYQLTQNSYVAALVAITSSIQKWASDSFWGAAGIETIMPRTLFLMFVPWLLLLWQSSIGEHKLWKMPFLALMIGLLGNLHPVSGYLFIQLFLVIIVLESGLTKEAFLKFILSAMAAVVGVIPTLLNYVRGIQGGDTGQSTIPFDQFYRIFHERFNSIFPLLPEEKLNFFGRFISESEQVTLVWVYLAILGILGVAYFLFRQGAFKLPTPHFFFIATYIIHLLMAFLLTRFAEPALVIFALLYLAFIVTAKPDKWDYRALRFMAVIPLLSFVAAYFLDVIWARFELWSMSSLVGEQLRMSRFIYLPLYIYLAKLLNIFMGTLPHRGMAIGMITSLALLTWLPEPSVAFIVAGFCFLLWFHLRYPHVLQTHRWLQPVLELIILFLVQNVIFVLLPLDDWLRYFILGAYLLVRIVQVHIIGQTFGVTRPFVILSTICLLFFLIALRQFEPGSLRTMFTEIKLSIIPDLTPVENDTVELYEWAKTHTDINSLFYTNSLDFRYWTKRSITHSWKDLGIAAYSRTQFIPFYDRFQKLEHGYEDPNLLLAYAIEYDVDFVIVNASGQTVLEKPIAFRNSTYTVYEID